MIFALAAGGAQTTKHSAAQQKAPLAHFLRFILWSSLSQICHGFGHEQRNAPTYLRPKLFQDSLHLIPIRGIGELVQV